MIPFEPPAMPSGCTRGWSTPTRLELGARHRPWPPLHEQRQDGWERLAVQRRELIGLVAKRFASWPGNLGMRKPKWSGKPDLLGEEPVKAYGLQTGAGLESNARADRNSARGKGFGLAAERTLELLRYVWAHPHDRLRHGCAEQPQSDPGCGTSAGKLARPHTTRAEESSVTKRSIEGFSVFICLLSFIHPVRRPRRWPPIPKAAAVGSARWRCLS